MSGAHSELYEVPKELPPTKWSDARKLDDDRDWLFASDSWQNDTELFGGRANLSAFDQSGVEGRTVMNDYRVIFSIIF